MGDTNAADALSELEKEWLTAEGKLQETVTPAQTDAASGHGPQVRMLGEILIRIAFS